MFVKMMNEKLTKSKPKRGERVIGALFGCKTDGGRVE